MKRLALLSSSLAALTIVFTYVPSAAAQSGQSTPGVIVTAVNPGTAQTGSDMKITLTAHTEESTATLTSCRPQDLTLDCWGSLVLRVPSAGGLSVSDFEVHRVAVGDTSCGDEGETCGDDGGGGGCSDEGGSCEGDAQPASATGAEPLQAEVNGVAVLTNPGTTGQPAGTKVQLKITLTDNGTAQYIDQVDVQINKFETGSIKPLLFQSGPQTVQQVQIHTLGG